MCSDHRDCHYHTARHGNYVYNNNNHHITVIIIIIIIITGTDMVLQYRPSLTGGNGGLS